MATAVVLALTAACLHALWNLAIKRSAVDRFHAIWGQVVLGSIVAAAVFVALGGMAAAAWPWAALSGAIHVPYFVLLTRAYDLGDFSQVYPIARGFGALTATVGGIALLGDRIGPLSAAAIGIVVLGLFGLSGRVMGPAVLTALGVGIAIGGYTLADSRGSRVSEVAYYGLGTGLAACVAISIYAVATGRHRGFATALRSEWRVMLLGGIAQKLTYTLVLAAVRLAPVGTVAALRETSVVVAVVLGAWLLGEERGGRRAVASATVVVGVIVLVATT